MSRVGNKSRAYVFTCNNYTDEDIGYLSSLRFQYLILGKEVAPTTGTKHLQGYVHYPEPRTIRAVRKELKKCHVERRLGTIEQAIKYCKKDGDWEEWGQIQINHQGS